MNDDVERDELEITDSAGVAAELTGAAPSFRLPTPPVDLHDAATIPLAANPRRSGDDRVLTMLPGARVDDFEIVRTLGRGAFGVVYLARQVSLDRQVALKVSLNQGSEGRTMARLEHQHIVQVFSETVDRDFNQRLLCMQLVPGASLDRLIQAIHAKYAGQQKDGPPPWNGQELLAALDAASAVPSAFDPSALHDREALSQMDAVEATAWFGARMAEALAFAHKHGVLHRDIKPANILVNPYGRPMLADFNISSQPVGSERASEEVFGGTLAYMSPEHLDAFNPADVTTPAAVDQRSDLYSLGLVLDQMLVGKVSFNLPPPDLSMTEMLSAMAEERRRDRAPCREHWPGARQAVERTIDRATAAAPDERFANCAELAEQLDGCRQLRTAERRLPRPRGVFEPILRRPIFWLVVLVVLPQIAASAVNITYNLSQIGNQLSEQQQALFGWLVLGYNALVYPMAIALYVLAVLPIARCWSALREARRIAAYDVAAARQEALRLPLRTALLTAFGWFPGGVLFPWMINARAGPLADGVSAHFMVSFFLSGLIALAYSLCGVEYVVLRVLYPALWIDLRQFDATTRTELAPAAVWLSLTEWLAISIPLIAAVLLLVLGGEANLSLRWLVTGLILFGIFGSQIANGVTRTLSRVVVVLTGGRVSAR